ncbi:hypothetical protein RFI_27099, partial [Reticulomyxa filosa]
EVSTTNRLNEEKITSKTTEQRVASTTSQTNETNAQSSATVGPNTSTNTVTNANANANAMPLSTLGLDLNFNPKPTPNLNLNLNLSPNHNPNVNLMNTNDGLPTTATTSSQLEQTVEVFMQEIHKTLTKFDVYGNGTLDPFDFTESMRAFLPGIDPNKCQILHEFLSDIGDDKMLSPEINANDTRKSLSSSSNPLSPKSTSPGALKHSVALLNDKSLSKSKARQKQTITVSVSPTMQAITMNNANTSANANTNMKTDSKLLRHKNGYSKGQSYVTNAEDHSRSSSGMQHALGRKRFRNVVKGQSFDRGEQRTPEDELVISDGSTLYMSSSHLKLLEMSIDKFIKVVRAFALSCAYTVQPPRGY